MQITDHWLNEALRCFSPNFNARPNEEDISLIVIHCISLPPWEFGCHYIDDLFCNRLNPSQHPYFETIATLQVSAHLLIRREGKCVQYVPFNQRAWHAGASEYEGRENCNDFSIGIELEGTETQNYTPAQYACLNRVIDALLNAYPRLSRQRMTGHSDIAPRRKTDPGETFDWTQIIPDPVASLPS